MRLIITSLFTQPKKVGCLLDEQIYPMSTNLTQFCLILIRYSAA